MPKPLPPDSEIFHPFAQLIGLSVSGQDAGRSRCVLSVDPKLLNPHRVLHGGVIFSMADTGMGAALYPCLEDDELCATVDIKIAYFGAVTSGLLTCDSRLLHKTRRLAFLDSEVTNDGRPVAKAMGTFSIFKASSAGLARAS